MTCRIWNEFVKSKDYFCYAQIIDGSGQIISLKIAEKKLWCHARILLRSKDINFNEKSF